MTSKDRWLLATVLVLGDIVAVFIPLAAILAAYVVVTRPAWFREGVDRLYSDPPAGES